MLDKKIFLRIGLLMFTGISCSLFSKVNTADAPTQETQPELYSLNDALTLAAQTLQAESRIEVASKAPTPDEVANASTLILCEHRVALGETLECIGRGYGVIPEVIAYANGIEMTSDLEIGQELLIPSVPWTNISTGPVCSPQCVPPDWVLSATEQTEVDASSEDTDSSVSEDNDRDTDQSVSNPPATEPSPGGEGDEGGGGGGGGNGSGPTLPDPPQVLVPVWNFDPEVPDDVCGPGNCDSDPQLPPVILDPNLPQMFP